MHSMMRSWFIVGFVATAVTLVQTFSTTPVEQCPGESFENLQDRIQVIPCEKHRCKLQRNTNITVIFKFAPKKEVKTLTNNVSAMLFGAPLPFVGVDGTSACGGNVTIAETGAQASCPLAANREYIYTNVFPVLSGYPKISTRVHWSLDDGHDKVICFEVPVIITQSTKKKSYS